MKIAVLGATGFTGVAVVREALDAGHDVRVLARTPSKVMIDHERLEVMRGDALELEDVLALVDGVDVVLHCLGVGGKGDGGPTTLVSDSVKIVVEAMSSVDGVRLVCMSNTGAGGSGPWFLRRVVVPLALRWLVPIIEDKDRMEAYLSQSDIDWVSIRLPNITEGGPRGVRTNVSGRGLGLSITNHSVGRVMLELACAPKIEEKLVCASN